jgi:hypothetical protein
MNLFQYLTHMREDVPSWLSDFKPGDAFPRQQFFSSRIIYYPGSGIDGHAVKVFGSTHAAHCFIYADYGIPQTLLEETLKNSRSRFRGYHTAARIQLRKEDIVPAGWSPHIQPTELPERSRDRVHIRTTAFAFLEILQREQGLDATHGAHRLAVLFLGADGIATYDALFCQSASNRPPFCLLLQDHGFGGNYDRFGKGGLLERIASRCGVMPQWLLAADNTQPWEGFEPVSNVEGDSGGRNNRFLYKLRSEG